MWRRPTLPGVTPVPSARQGLTSLFGMGRGGTPALGRLICKYAVISERCSVLMQLHLIFLSSWYLVHGTWYSFLTYFVETVTNRR